MATMKAVRFYEYGGPEVMRYEDVPAPVPGPGEVLVRVRAAAVNPVDWKIAAGYMRDRLRIGLPHVVGRDFSGTVEQVGPGVEGLAAGDDVFGRPSSAKEGADAEWVVVRPKDVAKKPIGIEHAEAAAIPTAGLAAWQALFELAGEPTMNLQPGQTVLIHGAAGGVGSFAVQLAKWKGARVIATAQAEHEDYLRQLGADVVVDYVNQRFEDVAHDVDGVLDTVGGETQTRSFEVVRPGGTLVSLVGIPTGARARERGVRALAILSTTSSKVLGELARLVERGDVRVEISERFPLEQARVAYEHSMEGHTQGKIVLDVAS